MDGLVVGDGGGAELFGYCEGQARLMLDRLGEEEEYEGVGWL